MKIIYKLSLFFAVLFAVSACNLNQYSDSTIAIDDPKEVFVTYEDAARFGTGLSAYFRGTTYGNYAAISEIQTDMFNASSEFGNRGGAPHTMNFTFTASDRDIEGVWNGYFNAIKAYNYFLENIHYVLSRTDLTKKQRDAINQWKGEAFFFRSYSYFELAKKFCQPYDQATAVSVLGLPHVTKYNVHAKLKREVLQETVDFIQTDLDSAKILLDKIPGVVRSQVPTIDATTALSARIALWTGDYTEAAAFAKSLIDGGKYTLATTAEDMTAMWIEEEGTEEIMQLYSSLTESPRSIGSFLRFAGSDGDINTYYPDFFPTKRLYDYYKSGDIRLNSYFDYMTLYGGGYYESGIVFAKFRGNPKLTSATYHAGALQAKVFRIAEMYLIKAEAEFSGNFGDPTSTLNALQVARGAAPTAGNLDNIKIEWAREMAGEGFRLECLKRWGDGFVNRPPIQAKYLVSGQGYITINIEPNSYLFTWPIPTSEMTYNESMKGQQNPGW